MPETILEGLRVAILATNGVEESELTQPREALQQNGAETVLIAPKPGSIQAMRHHDKSSQFEVDLPLDEARPEEFDAVLLPGGALNADALRADPKAKEFVQRMDEAGRPIAVICHGPWLLVSAELVGGRTLTSYHTIQDDIRNAGGNWVDTEVVRDGNWVSSRQPSDLPAFNREMVELFATQRQGGEIRKVS
ncbi:MAG: type 1 glutamine amidotransferase [Acidobacteria bacterium]|nr:type 1 glutamine amidotransferase [Acidobacteriota bacterium]